MVLDPQDRIADCVAPRLLFFTCDDAAASELFALILKRTPCHISLRERDERHLAARCDAVYEHTS